jgi:Trp operon repressor
MSSANDKRIRDLCRQAMSETEAHKLLKIFLELDRAAERAQRMEVCREVLQGQGQRQGGIQRQTEAK